MVRVVPHTDSPTEMRRAIQRLEKTFFDESSDVDHGGLGGLTDDDHTQYLLAAGTRNLTGDWTTGAFSIIGSDHWYLRADSVKQYFGTGDDASIYYDGTDLNINQREVGDGTVKFNGDIFILMSSDDVNCIEIDGTTNDCTNLTDSPRIIKARRDINYGTNDLFGASLFDLKIYPKHTGAKVPAAGNVEFYALSCEVQNDSTVVSDIAINRRYYQSGGVLWVDDNGNYDSQSTGQLEAWNWGSRHVVDNDCVFSDTGGNSPSNRLVVRCVTAETNVNPTLTSGILTVENIAYYAYVVGTAVGNSTGYGLYIYAVTGNDTNYGIWDASGANWVLNSDNQKIRFGATQGDFDLFSDGANAEIDSTGDIFLNSTGSVKFGTHAAITTETLSGYITIKDAAGNIRKLAVVS